jgi:hypothetical protein
MLAHWLSNAVVVLHTVFVAFVVLGGIAVYRWPSLAWVHVPAAVWGVLIEFAGWVCPLTPLENLLRVHAGEAGYRGGFVEHYLLRALYPAGLTHTIQWVLGFTVLLVNVAAYSIVLARHRASRTP